MLARLPGRSAPQGNAVGHQLTSGGGSYGFNTRDIRGVYLSRRSSVRPSPQVAASGSTCAVMVRKTAVTRSPHTAGKYSNAPSQRLSIPALHICINLGQ
jgi:hypothetical protein